MRAFEYNGFNDRVSRTVGLSTTTFILDGQGLPEVIYTIPGNAYLHLPDLILADNGSEPRFLLGDR